MNGTEFWRIKELLTVYPFFSEHPKALDSWWDTLKNYSFSVIERAVKKYIQENQATPTPAAILGYIPKAPAESKYVPRFEEINGKMIRVIQCQRCRDTGLLVWTGPDGNDYSRPCDCPAGHEKYTWGWLSREEQEKYAVERGYIPESVGESWCRE